MFKEYNERKVKELHKLKKFFEECVERSDQTENIVGSFGQGYSVFFGNAIQYNSFEIPISAMRLIYEANKKRIDMILNTDSK